MSSPGLEGPGFPTVGFKNPLVLLWGLKTRYLYPCEKITGGPIAPHPVLLCGCTFLGRGIANVSPTTLAADVGPFFKLFLNLKNKLTLLFITTKIYNSSFSFHSANSLRCGFFRQLLFPLGCHLRDATGHWFLLHGPGRPRCLKNI